MTSTAHFPIQLKNPALFNNRGFISGQWKHADKGNTFPVYEPSTGQVLAQCANFSQAYFVEAIEDAHKGYRAFYSSTTAKDRQVLLLRWNDLILANIEDLAFILSLENGKVYAEAKDEIAYAASYVSWFAAEAVRSYGDVIPSSYQSTTVLTLKEPVGVCAVITPWNFPAAPITRKVAPAFVAGCSVVIKPPSETPFSVIALVNLALQAGFPPNMIHVVPTKDRNAALELATPPKVRKVTFTGSTGVGKLLTQLASGTMKRVSMELGGNAPFIVFDDADLDKAVEGALICKFRASGQTCVCANRIYVHEKVLAEFTDRLIEKVQTFKLGYGLDSDTTHGALVNAAAVEKVASHVQDALQKGGTLRLGGMAPPGLAGYFYEPTIITGAHKDMLVARDETFGPVAAIFSFLSEEDVVMQANDTEVGLAGYFFSQDVDRVLRVARKLECGLLGVNTGCISAAESPFGGVKESGVGCEGSKYGLSDYQNIKSVTVGNQQT